MGGSLVGKNTLVKSAVECFDGRQDSASKNKRKNYNIKEMSNHFQRHY
jgi:hypothetical protein